MMYNDLEKKIDALLAELYRMSSKIDTPEEDGEELDPGPQPDGAIVENVKEEKQLGDEFEELKKEVEDIENRYTFSGANAPFKDTEGKAMADISTAFMKVAAYAHKVRGKSRGRTILRPTSKTRRMPRLM